MRMRRAAALVLLACWLAAGPVASVSAGKHPVVLEQEDGKYIHLHVKGEPAAQGWLLVPLTGDPGDEEEDPDPEAGGRRRLDLVVALHGAGGIPKNFALPLLMAERDAYGLVIAGRQEVRTARGEGFTWSGGDVDTILTLVHHVIRTYPIAGERVIVWGHSAGGAMALATVAKDPDLFAGVLTTAAPATPDGRHREKRVAVFLGTEDPNWGGAATVRSYAAKVNRKRGPGACAFFAVEGLGHELPYDDHLGLGFDWILAGSARGGEAEVPRRSRGSSGDYHHILVRHRSAAAGVRSVKRSRAKAEKALTDVLQALRKRRAFFPFEAAARSEHDETAACGGGIDEEDLRELLGDLPTLAPGAVSEILESPHGLHLVWRPPADADSDEDADSSDE